MAKWSSMRKGLKFRNFGVPTLLLTRAPAPSDCSIARNDLAILRGASVVRGSSGMTGRPRNMVVVLAIVRDVLNIVFVIGVMCFDRPVSLESIYSLLYTATAMARIAKKMDERVFMDGQEAIYTSDRVRHENVRAKLAMGLRGLTLRQLVAC
jgi:hypothetical protein